MATKKVRIAIDPIIIQHEIYGMCEDKTCRVGKFCIYCATRNKYINVGLSFPFAFQVVFPTHIYRRLCPAAGLRPVSTLFIAAVYFAALQYCNFMFTPTVHFGTNDDKWYRETLSAREQGKCEWDKG